MHQKDLKVSLIIPNYNGSKYIYNCLQSLSKVNYPYLEVIVCDDASTDNSVDIINRFAKQDNRLKIIKNLFNQGAAAAKNKAVALSRGDIVVFMDNDIKLPKNWLQELLAPLKSDPSLTATQSIIMDYDDQDLIQQAGGLITPTTGWLMGLHQNEKYSEIVAQKRLTLRSIVGVSGALAVRRSFFIKVKGFDTQEARHSEDIDFSWRVWIFGGQIKLAPASMVFHKNKPLSDRMLMNATQEYIHFHLVRNSIRSMLKNYELYNILRFLSVFLVLNSGRIIFALTQHNPAIIMGTLKALWWNMVHINDTLKARKFVQKNRKVTDSYLFGKVFAGSHLKTARYV